METNYPGIDYSGIAGTCNRGADGIRYGILSANCESLTEWFWESVESEYTARCPDCGSELGPDWEEQTPCPVCNEPIGMDSQWGDEPDGHILQGDDITGFVDDANDIWITDSPFFTYAQFCSPCAPGAGHLGNPCPDGPKTYCLGHDWFNDKAPYPVYSVKTGKLV